MKKLGMCICIGLYWLSAMGFAAESTNNIAISGVVSSVVEGKMEGVVVSAKRANSTITISVVSHKNGDFAFPREEETWMIKIACGLVNSVDTILEC